MLLHNGSGKQLSLAAHGSFVSFREPPGLSVGLIIWKNDA